MMTKLLTNRLGNSRGFTILEVIIAALITGILATASFRFYSSMHNSAETQIEVSDVQHLCRASVQDIKKTLRLAGFKLDGHVAYRINGDSLTVYFSETNPVDSVLYYLEEFDSWEYYNAPDLPDGVKLFKLMRRENVLTPAICSDYILDVDYAEVDSRTISITVTAQVSKRDDTFQENEGLRTWSLEEQVTLRNVNL